MASQDPREASVPPESSNARSTPEIKDTKTLFREAFERSKKMTPEEIYEKHPSWGE